MVDGYGPFPETPREPSIAASVPVPATRPPRRPRQPRIWPLAVALLILGASLVADASVLLLVREAALRAEAEVAESGP